MEGSNQSDDLNDNQDASQRLISDDNSIPIIQVDKPGDGGKAKGPRRRSDDDEDTGFNVPDDNRLTLPSTFNKAPNCVRRLSTSIGVKELSSLTVKAFFYSLEF